MEMADLFMLITLVLAGAASILVVTSRNVVHSALYLVVALLGVAGAFLLLGTEFLAWAQVLVYVGGVVILLLFGLMLTRAPIGPISDDSENTRLAFGVSATLFVFLMVLIISTFGDDSVPLTPTATIDLAAVLYVDWAFPLLALGFLLTVALVGAVILARASEGEGPLPEDEAYIDPTEVDPGTAGDAVGETGPMVAGNIGAGTPVGSGVSGEAS